MKEEKTSESKKTIYDGIKLSEKGRDFAVIFLSLALLLCLLIAFVSGSM